MDDDVTEMPDGSAVITEAENDQVDSDFMVNLVTVLDQRDIDRVSEELFESIERDKESRKKRDQQYTEGLRRTGLGDDAPGGAEFEGASKVVHPVLAEACVDYSAAAIKALFPSDGPVKMHQVERGAPSDLGRAERKRDFMNWQLTEQMPEYRSELEVLLTQQPLGGSQYMKLWRDPVKKRPCAEFVSVDYVYLPFSASSFEAASRRTIVVPLNRVEFERRVKSGMYADVDVGDPTDINESDAESANDRIEGRDDPAFNEDGLRHVYEVYTWLDIEGGDLAPYIISIDEHSRKCLAIYRNWDVNDEDKEELQHVVEFQFIPWRGAYGIGLIHLIGGLAGSATGALRALLDSAHLNNVPGGMKLKGARSTGETYSVAATEIVEVDAPPNVDDIRKVFMPWPFNQPSAVLLQLLGIVVETAKGVVSTAEERIADVGTNTPVGTTLALIEQGSKTFSAIHLRLHNSQAKVLRILQRINATYPTEAAQQKKFGRVLVTQEDFLTPDDIVPVSDPNIFSETQRYAQIQGLQQMTADTTVPWNKIEIYRRMMAIMRVEDPNAILPYPPEPVSADPVTEIVAAMSGQQIKAQPDMPHLEHIQEQLAFLLDPVFGAANPVNINPGFQMIFADIQQHLLFLYQQVKQQAVQMAQAQLQAKVIQQLSASGQELSPETLPLLVQQAMATPEMQNEFKQFVQGTYRQAVQGLQPLVAQLQQADELVKKQTPPPQMPPEIQAQIQAMQAETQRKAQYDQGLLQIKGQDMAGKQQVSQLELQMEQMQQEFDNRLEQARVQLKAQMDQMAQQVNLQKNREDNRQHMQTEIAKNHEDNQTQLFMEQMRQEGLQQRKELEEHQKEMTNRMDRVVELILAQITTSPAGRNGPDGESTGE